MREGQLRAVAARPKEREDVVHIVGTHEDVEILRGAIDADVARERECPTDQKRNVRRRQHAQGIHIEGLRPASRRAVEVGADDFGGRRHCTPLANVEGSTV